MTRMARIATLSTALVAAMAVPGGAGGQTPLAATEPGEPRPVAAMPIAAAPAAPPAGANLFVYRDHAEPTAWSPTVKVDGVKVVALPNRHFTATTVPSGPHKVTLSWPLISGQSGASMDVNVVAGQRRYLEVTGVSQMSDVGNFIQMGSEIAEVKPDHAEAVIAACCKFKAAK